MPDYEFYTDTFFGIAIAESDFPRLSARAKAWLDSTGCRLSGIPPDKLKLGICAIAEAWQINEQGGDLVSQSLGNHSKSFAQKKPKSDSQRLIEAAQLYLGNYCNLSVRWI